jgi:hypothetical protein
MKLISGSFSDATIHIMKRLGNLPVFRGNLSQMAGGARPYQHLTLHCINVG